jgi:hypothetical protein
MAAVLNYVEGDGQEPRELILSWNIQQYGVEGVMGRSYLGVKEMRSMNIADSVYSAFLSRDRYRDKDGNSNWSEWSDRYPKLAEILTEAVKCVNGH